MSTPVTRGFWIAPALSDEVRPWRAVLLDSLDTADISVGNRQGTDEINPESIQRMFDSYSGFVLGPNPTAKERYLASALLACLTTGDKSLEGKHVVFDNSAGAWNGLTATMAEQKSLGMIKNELAEVATIVPSSDAITAALQVPTHVDPTTVNEALQEIPHGCSNDVSQLALRTEPAEPARKVVVFCSASLKPGKGNPDKIDAAEYQQQMEALGTGLAQKGYGVIFGGTDNGLMGSLMKGVLTARGWLQGISIPRFFAKEGLKVGAFNKVDVDSSQDVHERVIKMVQAADAIVIAPGSLGTLHEAETVRHLLQTKHPAVKNPDGSFKPVYILNLPLKEKGNFWDAAIEKLDLNFGTTPRVNAADLINQIAADEFHGKNPFAVVIKLGLGN